MDRLYRNSSLDNHIRLVANVYDAHTAALFVRPPHSTVMELAARESLSRQFIPDCCIEPGHGLLGWVAKENRRLHVTSFDRDTRTLGIYATDVKIKALLASPLPGGRGVLMVDSRNRHAFPEKKQKILDDFAASALDLWDAAVCVKHLEFHRKFCSTVLVKRQGMMACIQSLAKLLGLDTVLAATRLKGEELYTLERLWRNGREDDRLRGKQFSLDSGYTGWFFRKGLSLVMKEFRGDVNKSYLLGEEEMLIRGEVLVGIVIPGSTMSVVVIFTGNARVSDWPEELIDMLTGALRVHAG